MLNLRRCSPEGGKDNYDAYVVGGGNDFPGGSLGRQFGLRVVYSARKTYRSLIGSTDLDCFASASYPNSEYIALHEGRKAGLSAIHIIATKPRLILS